MQRPLIKIGVMGSASTSLSAEGLHRVDDVAVRLGKQIPPDLVVKSQAVDIVDIIFRSFYEQSCNRVLGCNGKSRAKLPSLFRRPSVTTKFDGM